MPTVTKPPLSTTDVPEGQNLYYTDERVDDRVFQLLVAGSNITLDYDDVANTLTISATGAYTQVQEDGTNLTQRGTLNFTTGIIASDDTTNSRTNIALTDTGVAAGVYGAATGVGRFMVDAQGRLTFAQTVAIAIPAAQITDFAEAVDDRVASLLVAGENITLAYNNAANTLTITATAYATIQEDGTNLTQRGTLNFTTGLIASDDATNSRTNVALTDTGVTVGSYGSPSEVPTFTVDAQGRLTAASSTPISISPTQITDFAEAVDDRVAALLQPGAGIELTYDDVLNTLTITNTGGGGGGGGYTQIQEDGTNLTQRSVLNFGTGLLAADNTTSSRTDVVLTDTGVTAGSYGSGTQVPTFTVDAQGRLTAAANTAISITPSQVSNFDEAVDDRVAALLQPGTGIELTYDDVLNTLTITATGGGGGGGYNQIQEDGTNLTQRSILNFGTGLEASDDTTNARTNVVLTDTGVTAGSYGSPSEVPTFTVDAQGRLTAASNTAISIPSSQVNDFSEAVDNRVANLLVAGQGISLTYDDPGNTLTIASTIASQFRPKLTAHKHIYVRPHGSDSNSGEANTDSAAFRTLQRAIDEAVQYDLNGYDIIIHLSQNSFPVTQRYATGSTGYLYVGDVDIQVNDTIRVYNMSNPSYNRALGVVSSYANGWIGYTLFYSTSEGTTSESTGRVAVNHYGVGQARQTIGTGTIIIEGDTSDRKKVLIDGANAGGHCFRQINISTGYFLRYLDLLANSSYNCIYAYGGVTRLTLNQLGFGTANTHIWVQAGADVNAYGATMEIWGSAYYHVVCQERAAMFTGHNANYTLTGSLSFTQFVYAAKHGEVMWSGGSFSGVNSTGQRYWATSGAIIDVTPGNIWKFPGDSDGVVSNYGLYLY